MRERLRRFFNLRAGEGRKTVLLYSLHFIFYVGLMWGEAASLGLFVSSWGTGDLRYIFTGQALLAFVLGLVYTSFTDRVSNARLLLALCLVVGGGLSVVRLLLGLGPGANSLVYPLFLLLYRAFRPVFTLQVLNYINDFYDTRAAKRALPLMTSAAVAGAALAGLSIGPIIDWLGLENIVLGWMLCLLLVMGLSWLSERRLGQDRQAQTSPALAGVSLSPEWGEKSVARPGVLDSLRSGLRYVKSSPFLRLLAIATLAMAFINNLFDFQAIWAIAREYPGAEEQAVFYGVLGSLSSLLSLAIQMLLLGRLVTWLGVGISNLIFPFSSLLTYGLLGVSPNLSTAIGGRLNASVIKQSFRNPIDAMLYNTVPIQVKGRARAFINGLLVPVGVLVVGGLLFLVPSQASLPGWLVGLGIGASVLYVVISLRLKGEYSRALVALLEEEEFAFYRLVATELSIPDTTTWGELVQRLETSPDDDFTIFLAELIAQAGGQQAIPVLQRVASSDSPRVRGAALSILSDAGFVGAEIRELFVDGLSDESSVVRRAAIVALQRLAGPEDQEFLTCALGLLDDPDLEVRAKAIPPLIQSGDLFYQAAATSALSGLLKNQSGVQRATGIRILDALDDARFIRTLADYLDDADDEVRRFAALAVERLSGLSMPEWVRPLALETVLGMLRDPVERIRLAGVATLRELGGPEARKGLLLSLTDSSRLVRERAAEALQGMGTQAVSDLEAALGDEVQNRSRESERLHEAVSIVLARIERERFAPLINRQIDYNLRTGYETLAALAAVEALPAEPGVTILKETLLEYNDQRLERIFDLIASVRPLRSVRVVSENLHSPSARVRANAVEALESLTSPRTALLMSLLIRHQTNAGATLALGGEEWGITLPQSRQVLQRFSQSDDPWLQAITAHTLGQIGPEMFSRDELDEILGRCCDASQDPDVRAVSQIARLRLAGGEAALQTRLGKEAAVLSIIERVIFLKEVPFFESMTIEQLRVLASVSEERTFDEDEMIFAQGDIGDALYIVVSGRIGIEREGMRKGSVVRLATLSSRQYFGEMSIFDQEPRSAAAVAVEPTLLLSLRRGPLLALARENPDLSLELLRVLSRRLREANLKIAEKTKSRSRPLEKVYDKLDG